MELKLKKVIMVGVKLSTFVCILIVYACSRNINHSEHKITGRILNEKKAPIDNVTVLLKRKDSLAFIEHYIHGAISNSDGSFEIRSESNVDDFVLYFGKIGYKEQFVEIIPSLSKKIDVVLIRDTSTHVDFIPKRQQ